MALNPDQPAPKRRRWFLRFLVSLAIIVLFGIIGWSLLQPPAEPLYQGKPISTFLLGYSEYVDAPGASTSYLDNWDGGEAAMKAVGANAIPTLLRMMRARDTKFKLALIKLLQKQTVVPVTYTPAEAKNFAATIGFRRLGPVGISALPDLVRIYKANLSPSSTTAASRAIYDLAPYAIPQIDHAMSNGNTRVRRCLIGALASIHVQPAVLVPLLTKSLHDPDADVRSTAAGALAYYGRDAQSAIPDLRALAADSKYPDAASAAQYSLDRIQPR
jgi:HEAT repeats